MPLTEAEQSRYSRHLLLPEIGTAGQEKLRDARVLVVGAGGLGCPALQYLAAAGVGTLGVVDGDTVAESNLHRQILFGPADVGQSKAMVAAARLQAQNPLIAVKPHLTFLTRDNALSLLADYDLIVDGSDNFATRYLVNDACVLLNKPLVFGSIYRFEGQVSVFNVGDGPTYRCLYPDPSDLPSCAEAGVLGVLPGIVGCLMANEVIKLLTGVGNPLIGRLLLFDALTMQFQTVRFATDPANKQITDLPAGLAVCDPVPAIAYADYLDWKKRDDTVLLIDVRQPDEAARQTLGGQLIPLAELLAHPEQVPTDRPVVIHCQSGGRSSQAVAFLQERGYTQVWNLTGGINSVDPRGVRVAT
ncbi:molybdopterin-synthase adenylyltransferase MoeB [Spirosoma rhododendri]|uniref:Molybdopterin-synthase adenylyltransferase n=1 Tax=Spirosoma rhododendri TaxID=2728024 RepID=A0A7L5DNM2_9BACT|nr:molybdopterin-synthase adenylyltransferase MoeB [Spirosoma rhododendri]QJD79996.1 molybdopterin-synthase adenylyltransferase MoeB [Spirosoma rhododendri]